ncbi:glycosyltransferase family 2 protein [Buttiauxella massiliensis]|uniref:glycosyltransferase family 2 protein n=1 Tax=Buttiauxella massiliensis TaxID=2831590 RepID=UPI00125EA298|nr:glycosyltransferase [Buttiauxella massiliensis]
MTSLSILIPTKNRHEYLRDVLSSILSWDSQDFEIVVQDNSDDNATYLAIEEYLSDHRLKYFYESEWLSVVDNFELAITNSSGQIITAIGDDDGVLPCILLLSTLMIDENIDALLPMKADYTWPDLISKYNSTFNNSKLRYSKSISEVLRRRDAMKELNKVLSLGATIIGGLPRIYYGLVQRKCLDEVKIRTGCYLPGPSPDMANAVSLGLVVQSFFSVEWPVFIAGSSVKSTAGMGLKRTHIGNIEEISHLPKDTSSKWDSLIPKFWSGPTIWAQSASSSINEFHCKDDFCLNYTYLYARCFVFFPERFQELVQLIRTSNYEGFSWFKFVCYYVSIWKLRFDSLIPKIKTKFGYSKMQDVYMSEDVMNISQAVNLMNDFLPKPIFILDNGCEISEG